MHLGDRDVPNALTFIDKYNQVARILAPIVFTIEGLDAVWANPVTRPYIEEEFGGVREAKLEVSRLPSMVLVCCCWCCGCSSDGTVAIALTLIGHLLDALPIGSRSYLTFLSTDSMATETMVGAASTVGSQAAGIGAAKSRRSAISICSCSLGLRASMASFMTSSVDQGWCR